MPLRKLAGRALETALNHTLSLDPDTQQKLAALNGRRVLLHLRGPELALAVTVQGDRLKVGPPDESEAAASTLRVAATPGSLLAMALRRADEEAFARSFGDVLGVPLARAARKALAHAKETASHLTEDGAAWLRDESRLALAPGEAEAFLDGVDSLRERSDRLEARLARLAARLKGTSA